MHERYPRVCMHVTNQINTVDSVEPVSDKWLQWLWHVVCADVFDQKSQPTISNWPEPFSKDYRQGDFTRLVPDVFAADCPPLSWRKRSSFALSLRISHPDSWEESLDAVYYIESSCHIANRTEPWLWACRASVNCIVSPCQLAAPQEVFQASAKALKKGAKLFSYEYPAYITFCSWCFYNAILRLSEIKKKQYCIKDGWIVTVLTLRWVMTDRFDPTNPEHVAIKKGIELGDGIEARDFPPAVWHVTMQFCVLQYQELVGIQVPLEALRKSGFRILEHGSLAGRY